MKKKLFTLLTLLLCVCSGAWGATETITTVTKDTEYSGTCVTIGSSHFAQTQSNATYIKMRTGNYSNTWVFTVKSGYKVTGISIKGYSNNTGATISMTSLKANGTEQLADAVVFPVSGTAEGSYANINKSGFEVVGEQTITCTFDNSNCTSDNDKKNRQVMAKITFTYEVDGLAAPTITPDNDEITLSCATDGAQIYYTTDGTTPTSLSSLYLSPFTINSCTVKAIAIKDEETSSVVSRNCYVDHSEADKYIEILKWNGGTGSGTTWTSKSQKFTLTASNNNFEYGTLAASNDAFKLNHVDAYTLTPASNIKITKILIIAKTNGGTDTNGTISITGFTPASGSFASRNEGYIKTIEYTPSSELTEGEAVTITPGEQQLLAYIEVYGEQSMPTHIPGDYTTTYGQTPVESDGRLYEVYGFSSGSSSANYICAGSPTTSLMNPNNVGPANKSDVAWITNSINGRGSDYLSLDAKYKEFSTYPTDPGTAYSMKYQAGKKLTIKVSGYDQFSILAKDANTSTKCFTVKIDDSENLATANNSQSVRRFDMSTGVHIIEVEAINTSGGSDSNEELWGFSLRLPNKTTITPAKEVTTYVTTQVLDFTNVDGLKAYIATSKGDNTVNMTAVDAPVPAGTALLLKKTSGTSFDVPVVASATAPTTNYLKAGPITFTGSETARYILKDGEFYLAGAGKLAAGKAYLDLTGVPTLARQLSIVFDDEETTGISNVDITKPEVKDNVYYNLNGQRVANPSKGLFIVNGKKVIIK